jgi:hypothetical protein
LFEQPVALIGGELRIIDRRGHITVMRDGGDEARHTRDDDSLHPKAGAT